MTEGMAVSYVLNLVWMASAIALLCKACERVWLTAAHREALWTMGLILAVVTPLAGVLLPVRLTQDLPGLRFTGAVSLAAGDSRAGFTWTQVLLAAYSLSVAFAAARLYWRWARLARLNEDTIPAPVTFGLLRPRVLIPAAFGREASPLALEAALAHERAHLQRADFARNLACEFAALPAAFHPAVWYVKDRLAQARELVCDDLAARATGGRRRYAQGLIEAAQVIVRTSAPASRLAMGLLDHTDFEERITMLQQPPQRPSRRGYLLLGAVLALAPAMTLSGFYLQDPDPVHRIGDGVSSPKLIHKEEPRYSSEAEAAKIEGTVVLRTAISKTGLAENVEVIRSLHAGLDASAVDCVKRWRFEPGQKDGVPVRVRATIEVNFKLK